MKMYAQKHFFRKIHKKIFKNNQKKEKSPSANHEFSSLIFEKKDSNNQKTNSIFVSSFYSSEDERKKKETFEKKMEYLSDEKYFMKIKEEKSPLKLQNNNKTYYSDQYIELNDISNKESWFRV